MPDESTRMTTDNIEPAGDTMQHHGCMITAAISFLNNHLPAYGFGPNPDGESWKADDGAFPTYMGAVPKPLVEMLERAQVEAARFLMLAFRMKADELASGDDSEPGEPDA